jgi:DNA-binding response OmpR family regulator
MTQSNTATAGSPLILLVSDDLMMGSRVKEGVKVAGYGFASASTETAVQNAIASEQPPAAILVALTVRRLDPYALIRMLKAEHPGVPILAFAGHVEREKHALAREAGADLVTANSSVAMHLPALLSRLLGGERGDALEEDGDEANR